MSATHERWNPPPKWDGYEQLRERAERAEARVAELRRGLPTTPDDVKMLLARIAELEAVTKRAAIAGIRAQEGDDGLARIMDDLSKENNRLEADRDEWRDRWAKCQSDCVEKIQAVAADRDAALDLLRDIRKHPNETYWARIADLEAAQEIRARSVRRTP